MGSKFVVVVGLLLLPDKYFCTRTSSKLVYQDLALAQSVETLSTRTMGLNCTNS